MASNNVDDQDKIRQAAYYLWELAGRPEGGDLGFWLAAEQECLARQQSRPPGAEESVDEAALESFPASDPPAWNP